MKNFGYVAMVILALCCGSAAASQEINNETGSQQAFPKLVVEPTVADLGTVREGGVYEFEYQLQNQGKATLEIQNIRAQCGCTVTQLDKKELAPGETVFLKARFDSKGRSGAQHKSITVISNDPNQPQLKLTFRAEVESLFEFRPPTRHIVLRSPKRGTPLEQTVEVWSGRPGTSLELLEVGYERPGMTHQSAKLEEHSKEGIRLSFVLEDDIPLGIYHNKINLRLRVGEEEAAAEITVSGRIASDIVAHPRLLLSMTPILPGSPIPNGRITLRASDTESPFEIHSIVTGSLLNSRLEVVHPGIEYHVHMEVAEDAPAGPVGCNVFILTSSKEQPVVSVPAFINVGSLVECQPETVYLRQMVGDAAPPVQRVTMVSSADSDFVIEGVSTDNPNILPLVVESKDRENARSIDITLIPNASPGEYRGRVFVDTSVQGGHEAAVDVFVFVEAKTAEWSE